VNGALDGEKMVTLPANVRRARNEIGRSSYPECNALTGNIAEIIVYTRALAETERATVEAYLRSKWDLY